MIRPAQEGDWGEVLRMAHAFHERSKLQFALDEEAIRALFWILQSPPNLLLVSDPGAGLSGMVGLMVYPHVLNRAIKVCQEFMWWAESAGGLSSVGGRLLISAESWAREQGCQLVMMGALDLLEVDQIAQLYLKRGYHALERSFVRYL